MSIGPARRLPWEEDPVLLAPVIGDDGGTDDLLLVDMWEAQVLHGREYARDLEAIARLAARRRRQRELATVDGRFGPGAEARATGDPLLAVVREDFVAELALSRGCSEHEAGTMLREALLLTGVLAQTWSHLFGGCITVAHAKAAVDLLGDAAPEVAAEVQARVLPRAAEMTAPAFRDRLRYHLYRADAEAKERRRREARTRIGVHKRRFDEGVSELVIQGPTPAVHAADHVIDSLARMRRADGDTRSLGMLRAETALDLMLRPWDDSRPAVTAQLVIHSSAGALRPDGDPGQTQQPAEVDGEVVSAAECREILRELEIIGVGDPPVGGSVRVAVGHPVTGEVIAVATRAELRRAAGVGRRRRGSRRNAPGLRPPPDTPAYEPTAAQKRFLGARDRGCRMPGCRRRVGRCDLDHHIPYEEGGPTACWNLCCLCKRHHRIKTFARDWSFRLVDGTLLVRTPGGVTRATRPPGWYADPEPQPPWLDDLAPPDPLRM